MERRIPAPGFEELAAIDAATPAKFPHARKIGKTVINARIERLFTHAPIQPALDDHATQSV